MKQDRKDKSLLVRLFSIYVWSVVEVYMHVGYFFVLESFKVLHLYKRNVSSVLAKRGSWISSCRSQACTCAALLYRSASHQATTAIGSGRVQRMGVYPSRLLTTQQTFRKPFLLVFIAPLTIYCLRTGKSSCLRRYRVETTTLF